MKTEFVFHFSFEGNKMYLSRNPQTSGTVNPEDKEIDKPTNLHRVLSRMP